MGINIKRLFNRAYGRHSQGGRLFIEGNTDCQHFGPLCFCCRKKKVKHSDFVVDSIAKMPKNLVLNMESIKRA